MRKRKLHRRWERRFKTILGSIQALTNDCLRASAPETIHELRVNLRRARLLALIGAPSMGQTEVARFRQWALKLATALSNVRDCDVMLDWLKANFPDGRENQLLEARRVRAWRAARPKLLALARHQRRHRRNRPRLAARPRKLRQKWSRERDNVRQTIARDAARFHHLDEPGLHEFRRALRRLRYLRELGLSRRRQKRDPALRRIVSFQEALGERQNCSLVRASLSRLHPLGAGSGLVKLAEAQQRKWLSRAELHLAAFLKEDLHF